MVVEDIGLPSKVLPVVSIVTLSFVVFLVEGAPLCLEIEHVEVKVFLHEVDDACLDIAHGVSEGAVLAIFAVSKVFGESSAELCLVLLNMVESLNSVVGQFAGIFALTAFSLSVVAKVWTVIAAVPSSFVLIGVVKATVLVVVLVMDLAHVHFEFIQNQVLHHFA